MGKHEEYPSAYNTRRFGKLAEYLLDSEAERQNCPDQVFLLVLLLRRILGKSTEVFYKTQWDVGINDGNHDDVILFIYRPGCVPALQEVAWASHDSALDVGDPSDCHYGSIESLGVRTVMGRALYRNAENLQQLLRTAAATVGIAISFVQLRPGEIQIILDDDGTVDHVGTILTNDHLPAWHVGSDNIALSVN
jgi:hypothetical protein